MKKAQLMVSALLLVLLLLACAPKAAPAPTAVPAAPAAPATALRPAPAAPLAPAKATWQLEWDRTVAAAKKEGTVVLITTTTPQVRRAMDEMFRSRFGISIEWLAGSGNELGTRRLAERRAGIYSVDVGIIGASVPYLLLKPAGVLDRLEGALVLPELIDPREIQRVWRLGDLEWVDKDRTMLSFAPGVTVGLAINTQLVKPGEIKGYQDLLNPKWKGKIIIQDPTLGTGAGNTWVYAVGTHIMGWDYMRKLVEQEPFLTRDARLQVEWLAHGKYSIALAPRSESIKEFADAGAPLQTVMTEEGGYTSSGSGTIILLKDAPHPNAAKLFINWLLSEEGQSVWSKAYGNPSGRKDVSVEGIDPLTIPDPKMKYVHTTEETLLGRPEADKMAKEIFGKLKK